MLSKISVVWWL